LLRAFSGEYDRDFTEARLAEVRELLEATDQLGGGVDVDPIPAADGYRGWAETYDQPGNALIDIEQPAVREILDGFEPGTALDVACGTGRHTAYLAAHGHDVIGVDDSAEMLAKARAKMPGGRFLRADLHDMPIPYAHVDVVVCALALVHVPDLAVPMAEFGRVLRPGGHLVISDSRGLFGEVGVPLVKASADGVGYIPNRIRSAGDYLRAALAAGFEARRCEEPLRPTPLVDAHGTPPGDPEPVAPQVPGSVPEIWSLHPWCPEAVNAAFRDTRGGDRVALRARPRLTSGQDTRRFVLQEVGCTGTTSRPPR
jgi:SAM-dependent methyltransferase